MTPWKENLKSKPLLIWKIPKVLSFMSPSSPKFLLQFHLDKNPMMLQDCEGMKILMMTMRNFRTKFRVTEQTLRSTFETTIYHNTIHLGAYLLTSLHEVMEVVITSLLEIEMTSRRFHQKDRRCW